MLRATVQTKRSPESDDLSWQVQMVAGAGGQRGRQGAAPWRWSRDPTRRIFAAVVTFIRPEFQAPTTESAFSQISLVAEGYRHTARFTMRSRQMNLVTCGVTKRATADDGPVVMALS
jgi:hypothetical protein